MDHAPWLLAGVATLVGAFGCQLLVALEGEPNPPTAADGANADAATGFCAAPLERNAAAWPRRIYCNDFDAPTVDPEAPYFGFTNAFGRSIDERFVGLDGLAASPPRALRFRFPAGPQDTRTVLRTFSVSPDGLRVAFKLRTGAAAPFDLDAIFAIVAFGQSNGGVLIGNLSRELRLGYVPAFSDDLIATDLEKASISVGGSLGTDFVEFVIAIDSRPPPCPSPPTVLGDPAADAPRLTVTAFAGPIPVKCVSFAQPADLTFTRLFLGGRAVGRVRDYEWSFDDVEIRAR